MFINFKMPSHLIPSPWPGRPESLRRSNAYHQVAALALAACATATQASFAASDGDLDTSAPPHFGYIDKTGRFVIKPIYDSISPFSENCAIVKAGNELQVIDKTGKVLFKRDTGGALASVPGPYKEGLSLTNQGSDGYVNKSGTFVIAPKFQMARDFSEGYAAVATGEQPMTWSFIDKSGKVVIPGPFQMALSFSQGLAPVMVDNKWGFIDQTGKFVIAAKYAEVSSFADNLAAVQDLDEQWHYIDRSGAPAFDGTFGLATPFAEGTAFFGKKDSPDLTGCLDSHGKTVELKDTIGVIPAGKCSNGLIPVKNKDKLFGFANPTTGAIVIQPQFQGTFSFSDGLAAVCLNGKWGFMDPAGKLVVEPTFSEADSFSEGLAGVGEASPSK